jgi:methionyl-tRNA synthetase
LKLGHENVIFVSGTDCYGAGPEVKHAALTEEGYGKTIEEFLQANHESHARDLRDYHISANLFGASALGDARDVHHAITWELFNAWHEHGYLTLNETMQFYDEENHIILNGRQVEGRCPIAGCKAEKAYADECALGHQFSPTELIAPKSVTTGKEPTLISVKNWYFDLERFGGDLKKRQLSLREEGISRRILLSIIDDYLKDPQINIKTEDFDTLQKACAEMPSHIADIFKEKQSAVLTFKVLKNREKACEVLRAYGIRYRTGTTLVPFRLTGNIKWGIPVPEKDGVSGQTFWVWPESLWAPLSFTQTYLNDTGSAGDWRDWWLNPEAKQYQFIGEDNVYFYAVAEMGLFMALNLIENRTMDADLPTTVPHKHLFFGNKKAASSGALKPPSPQDLLTRYTAEQIRMHFAHMALHSDSVKFVPKALMEGQTGFDATLAEGNILTNVYNRLVRSCFYTMQKYFDGKLPEGEPSDTAAETAQELINNYEWAMYRFEFSKAIDLLDEYLRNANKDWAAKAKEAEKEDDVGLRAQILLDTFHTVKVAAVLLHPFAPQGTEIVREYLGINERLWDWATISKPLTYFIDENHTFKFLEPKTDFFAKHPSQLVN